MFPSRGGAHTRPQELFAGRYAVDGPLPWGGLSTHYRAAAEGTPLVLCVLPMDVSRSVRASAAFAELAQRLGAVQTRAVPRILDAGILDGVPYLAFRDTRGTVLANVLRDRKLSPQEVLRLADGVLDALEEAHSHGLVHGDLTPQNVLVTRSRDGRLAARVIGMGVLPLLRANPEASAHPSPTGSGKHAISYMAPELFGEDGLEPRSDLYALGSLLHHMATGSPPTRISGTEGFDELPGLPDVIRRAMAKRVDKRYPTAASMRTALDWIEVQGLRQPPRAQSNHPPGTILSTSPPNLSPPIESHPNSSGPRPIPVQPIRTEQIVHEDRRRIRLTLLLILLGTLLFSGYWQRRQTTPSEAAPIELQPETADVR